MVIIVEGPDGSGKSYLVDRMVESGNFFRYPPTHQGPPKTREELIDRLETTLAVHQSSGLSPQTPVFDRFGLFSEQIYGSIVRKKEGGCVLTNQDIRRFENRVREMNARVIYCRPSLRTLKSVHLEVKPHKNHQHIYRVIQNQQTIIIEYDILMFKYERKGFEIIRYNRDIHDVKGVIEYVRACVLSGEGP